MSTADKIAIFCVELINTFPYSTINGFFTKSFLKESKMVVNRQYGGGIKSARKEKEEKKGGLNNTHVEAKEVWQNISWIEDSKGNPFYPQGMFLNNGGVKVSTMYSPNMTFTMGEKVCLKNKLKLGEKCRDMRVVDIQIKEGYKIFYLEDLKEE